ncbi:hypothetical protein DFH08DRAFT_1072003 [Mycena albidolilacea]|uniref:F-box domain-containing protein n=1 Tax=Mycena albidolilacea TaxID=1033008 RepID=A0AAD7AR81_9AGAR|nr:hypothetical protein DFH08DRAFT_1072003 [Mycena albidolilacea]
MAITSSICAIVLEQTERTRQSSKADIERLIDQTQLKIASLRSQIERERAIAAALRYIISPVRALPVELLAEIFVLAIRDRTHITDVLRLSQVCSDWRQVAHATPRLWTGLIRVNLDNESGSLKEAYADGLKAWLARSLPHPVPISFMACPPKDTYCRILAEILKTSPRWGSADLRYAPLWLINRVAECRLDNLEELSLGTIGPNTSHLDPLCFTGAPRLRKLGVKFHSNDPQILMPWAQLTDITIDSSSHDIALDILVQCTDLIRASLCIPGWHELPEAERDIHVLSRLRTLSFALFGSAGKVSPFFDCISAPALEELCLHFDDMENDVDWKAAHLPTFQVRAPHLARLDLRYATLRGDDLIDVLHYAPALTHLKLFCCWDCFDDIAVGALHYKEGVRPLVPHLHNLILEHTGEMFTPGVLADMITSRWAGAELATPPAVAHWTLVRVKDDHTKHFADVMEVLHRKGLPIELLNRSGNNQFAPAPSNS